MGPLATILLVILAISFTVFVIFFGRIPALRNTPIASLNKLLVVHIPNGVLALDQALTSGRLTSCLKRFGHNMMYERHPTVLIFFVLILSVSECLYLPSAWPKLGALNKTTGAISIALPYLFLYLAAFGDPGFITPANHAYHMQLYPYDYSIFHPGQECSTCHALKPPRSKHCSLCKRCVSRMDHHCIFINKCVGYGNHHWFLLLLVSTAVLVSYGGILGALLFSSKIRAHYPAWSIWPPAADMSWNRYLALLSWSLQGEVGLGAVTLLCVMISPMVWGLLLYTLYLVYCGTTTNESMKWSDWKAEMDDGFAFKRRMNPSRRRFQDVEPPCPRWPLSTEQVLTRTDDGLPPPIDARLPGEGEWERIWRLDQVENIYDLGFRDNLVDIFVRDAFADSSPSLPGLPSSQGARKKRKARVSPI